MDLLSSKEDTIFGILIILFPLIATFICYTKFISSKLQKLPPGPYPWPIIGNIPHVLGKNPHVTVTNLAKIHGPLISMKLGTQLVVIGSSPSAASEILKTHDRELSARYAPKATPIKESDLRRFSLLWSTETNNHWKSVRVLWKSELFSNKAIELQANTREKKANEMVEFLGSKEGKVVSIGDVVFSTVYNTLGNICFSRDMISIEDENVGYELKKTYWRFMESGTTPIVADLFPVFDGFDVQGQRKIAQKSLQKMFDIWDYEIKLRRECSDGSNALREKDFLDFMISNEFSDVQIKYMLLEIFPAGTGTLTSTIEWAMAELIKNKDSMNKLRQELQSEIGSNSIEESRLSNLPYLNACIKETLRLHPPIAFLPHRAHTTCEVMNYMIPKDSLVFVNLWAIGHDPDVWDDPFAFKPERFLNSSLDIKGRDFEFIPFGAGRRMCPGLPFAAKQAHLILASLIGRFEWSLADDSDPSQLDMNEKYAVPLQKEQPLLLVPAKIVKLATSCNSNELNELHLQSI